ncbi:MAG: hypothetical protein COA78_29500 [Blastopirellula sp.]|nr:MAG: hypothetical protein COA78_29500 [Blastopirellula sp.]
MKIFCTIFLISLGLLIPQSVLGNDVDFKATIRPLLTKYCQDCHGPDEANSKIRVDILNDQFQGKQLFDWDKISHVIESNDVDLRMPPEDELQPTQQERELLTTWITNQIKTAKTRDSVNNGYSRRLTKVQYRNTLRDLLLLSDDFTAVLPNDGVTKEGYNSMEVMQVSPLHLEYYFEIAAKALDQVIVDPKQPPQIHNFRMNLGKDINPENFNDKLILGAGSRLIPVKNFTIEELTPEKDFPFTSHRFQKKFSYIEGYIGNGTIRKQKEFIGVYHNVFACLRGQGGYTGGLQAETVIADGLLLRPSIPNTEIFMMGSTYGPSPNFKISLRELPVHGKFRVKVTASKYADAYDLDSKHSPVDPSLNQSTVIQIEDDSSETVQIPMDGIYQVDLTYQSTAKNDTIVLALAGRPQNYRVSKTEETTTKAFKLIQLKKGKLNFDLQSSNATTVEKIILSKLDSADPLVATFEQFNQRSPQLGVYLGFRRDCGSALSPVQIAQTVSSTKPQAYYFEDAISNYPISVMDKANNNYLAGVSEIGVRNEYLDGRAAPRLLVHSVEFEGPFFELWPPKPHKSIFIDSPHVDSPEIYATEVIRHFMERAYRRPITEHELNRIYSVWQKSYQASTNFYSSIKDALTVVLCTPQFLMITDASTTPASEQLTEYELASKLAYFLWNSSPDDELLSLAKAGELRESLNKQIDRMLADPKSSSFFNTFVSQWLNLEKITTVEINRKKYPRLTKEVKNHLRQEPIVFFEYLVDHNLELSNIIDSDFILANDVVASYYGLDSQDSGLKFIKSEVPANRGGLLAQAGILAGLSNGDESNPVKRGNWIARKIISEPPGEPPPNVPDLKEVEGDFTLRQRLEMHRNKKGCVKCHTKIDPWGIPLEQFDAAGIFQEKADCVSELPDGQEIQDFKMLQNYLISDKMDQIAIGFMQHLSTYALGRSLTFKELDDLNAECRDLKQAGYRVKDIIKSIANSQKFQTK